MTGSTYRFRDFHLDPQARELHRNDTLVALPASTLDCLIYLVRHRERLVGRDELTAAVWDRVDVSDVSLSHAIVRLRRLLGDTGNEQNSIRTLPRIGYRWIVEPTIEEIRTSVPPMGTVVTAPALTEPPAEAEPASAAPVPRTGFSWRAGPLLWSLLTFGVLSLLALLFGLSRSRLHVDASAVPSHQSAMVLPAEVDASGDWKWLRLGFMDLVANRLRDGGLATTPSETVVSLLDAQGTPAAESTLAGSAALLVRPHVTFANGSWNVHLDVHGGGRDLTADAQGADVLVAGHMATDELLVKLGLAPPATEETNPSHSTEELVQRVNAAVLAGQLQIARTLIQNAPEAAQRRPEIALSQAAIEFFSGEYDASRQHAEAVLDLLPGAKNPRLRARVLNRLGAAYVRLDRDAEADAAFVEAIQLLELQDDPDTLATAYTGRGVVAGQAGKLDAAAAFFGQARTLHEVSNDAFGVARVDLNLGAIAIDRGQPAAAVPIVEDAAKRFQTLATPEALNAALRLLADAQSMLLEHERALAATDRFWPVEMNSRNQREAWWLLLSRAVALAGVGRLHDADDLIKQVRESSDPDADAVVRIEAVSLAANLALLRGDNANAAALAGTAMTPVLEHSNWRDYASTWFTRVRALQRSGEIAAAAGEVKRLRTWANMSADDRRMPYILLAEADQANVEGRLDVALSGYADALESAEHQGVPEDIVAVGESYGEVLLAAGRIDQASALSGRMAPWAGKDMRAAWVQAQIYRALGKTDDADKALDRARRLAGERALPGDRVAPSR